VDIISAENPGGEILIEKRAEALFDYQITNSDISEIKGHIMRYSYHPLVEIDADVNVINMRNGLYDISVDRFIEHTPDYLSINQSPIFYNKNARPKLFGTFLSQVLYPSEIRTAIELIAYTFYRDNPFEIITTLHGYGANGKSVFTRLITALHGARNISNVPLTAMVEDRFALSDLENKYANIDTELTSTTINNTSVLKKITGRQPVRIERKNQPRASSRLFITSRSIIFASTSTIKYVSFVKHLRLFSNLRFCCTTTFVIYLKFRNTMKVSVAKH